MNSQHPHSTTAPIHVTLANAPTADRSGVFGESAYSEPALPESHPLNVSRTTHRLDVPSLQIINEAACASNRWRAAESIVRYLANLLPETTVRCAIGNHRIQRFCDSRLGWLGPQSSVRTEADSKWETHRKSPTGIYQEHDAESSGVVVCLRKPDGSGQCVLWIDGESMDTSSLDDLEPIAPILCNVFWRRPRLAVPQVLSQIGSRAKTYAAIAAAVVVLVAIWPTRYPVSCTAKVEPVQQRLVSAPFEATLLQSHVRPGDSVRQGDPLAVLDGRPLRLELESIESELHQTTKERNVALATGRVAEAQQLALQQRGLQRRVDLLNDRLNRLTITSPIDGVVVSGDLQRLLGASLDLGQTIIEVAAMDQMAIEIEIPGHEIGLIQPDSMTRVRIGSLGGRSIRQPLTDLYPAAEIRDDRNVFVGRVMVDNAELQLKPGMRGDATTYGPIRPLAWSWVRGGWEKMLWWCGY